MNIILKDGLYLIMKIEKNKFLQKRNKLKQKHYKKYMKRHLAKLVKMKQLNLEMKILYHYLIIMENQNHQHHLLQQ